MKTFNFTAEYTLTRNHSVTAETAQEAKDLYDANEWDDESDSDCILQSANEPDWGPLFDDDAVSEDDNENQD